MKTAVEKLVEVPDMAIAAKAWLACMDDGTSAEETGSILLAKCKEIADKNENAKYVVDNEDMLPKPSMWI
ncbi:MAG: hypothetical protein RR257_07470, partial [Rikenellaceae bacterium]